MQELKSFLFNSLTVSVGLIIYTLFIYMSYLMFFKEIDEPNNEDNIVEKKENNEKLENYDILEDID